VTPAGILPPGTRAGGRPPRGLRAAAWAVLAAGSGLLLLLGICLLVDGRAGDPPWPLPRPSPDTPGETFRVAVLGDAQKGTGTLARLLEAVRESRADLILQTGDLVASNDEGHYRLAALLFRRSGLRVPMAVVPGNHDLKGDPSRFERRIGPREQTFRRGRVAFFLRDDAFGDPPDPQRLESEIARVPPGDAVVLAMHVPPFDEAGDLLPRFGPFVRWLRGSRVRYLLCGQLHRYVRRTLGGTVVIANGVGGDYESWHLRQKAFLTILEVDGTSITDRPVACPPAHGLAANLEHLALGHVGEAFRTHPWGGGTAAALLAGVVALAAAFLRRRGRPNGPAPRDVSPPG